MFVRVELLNRSGSSSSVSGKTTPFVSGAAPPPRALAVADLPVLLEFWKATEC